MGQQLRTAGLAYTWYGKLWNVYEIPGEMWLPNWLYKGYKGTKHAYFLVPDEYPGFAAGIASTKFSFSNWFDQSTSKHDFNAGVLFPIGSQEVVDTYNLGGGSWKPPNFAPFDPALVQNSLCTVKDHC